MSKGENDEFKVNSEKVDNSLTYKQGIDGLRRERDALTNHKAEVDNKLSNYPQDKLETPEGEQEYDSLAQESKGMQSEIDAKSGELGTMESDFEKWKQENQGVGQEANEETIANDYKKREGRDLDANVAGQENEDKPQGKITGELKDQADNAVGNEPKEDTVKKDSLAGYPPNPKQDLVQQQEQQQDIDRWEDDGGR